MFLIIIQWLNSFFETQYTWLEWILGSIIFFLLLILLAISRKETTFNKVIVDKVKNKVFSSQDLLIYIQKILNEIRFYYLLLTCFSMLLVYLISKNVYINFHQNWQVYNNGIVTGDGSKVYTGITILDSNLWHHVIETNVLTLGMYLGIPVGVGIAISKSDLHPVNKCLLIMLSEIIMHILLRSFYWWNPIGFLL